MECVDLVEKILRKQHLEEQRLTEISSVIDRLNSSEELLFEGIVELKKLWDEYDVEPKEVGLLDKKLNDEPQEKTTPEAEAEMTLAFHKDLQNHMHKDSGVAGELYTGRKEKVARKLLKLVGDYFGKIEKKYADEAAQAKTNMKGMGSPWSYIKKKYKNLLPGLGLWDSSSGGKGGVRAV